jgi:predicted NUDIX family NTP pyrophosphohydrolase
MFPVALHCRGQHPVQLRRLLGRLRGTLRQGERRRQCARCGLEAGMPRRSAGILLYRHGAAGLEVFLVHPGGPFWAKRDEGAWSIPKGEYSGGEDALAAARREFAEETGLELSGDPVALGSFRQSRAKTVDVWAVEGNADPDKLHSITFAMEWPPRSGRMQEFPEVDRAAWFALPEAARRIHVGQVAVLEALCSRLRAGTSPPSSG